MRDAGYNPFKINFNGGDWFFSRGDDVINFRGTAQQWGPWFRDFVALVKPEFIMLIGAERPLHAVAVRIGQEAGVPVWILEEGYIRPDFVTCELNGVNARSPLSDAALSMATPDRGVASHVHLGNSLFSMAYFATLYYFGLVWGRFFFPHYQHHRKRGLVSEFFFWNRNVWRKFLRWRKNHRVINDLIQNHKERYFLVALQVSDDLQLTANGDGWSIEQLITTTIKSFAVGADPGDLLVFKAHPLDRGHFPHAGLIRQVSRLAGCESRVRFVDDGSVSTMLHTAKGAITINSTTGLSALYHGIPLLTLGKALYKRPELTHGNGAIEDLNSFWNSPRRPDVTAVKCLLDRIRNEALINGSFYIRSGFKLTFDNLLNKVRDARQKVIMPGVSAADDAPSGDSRNT